MTRGDTKYLHVRIANADGPLDLTGKTLRFTAKRSHSNTDAEAVTSKVSGDGIELMEETGMAEIALDPADTRDLPARLVRLVYDVQLKSGSEVFTVAAGTLTVNPDVTITA